MEIFNERIDNKFILAYKYYIKENIKKFEEFLPHLISKDYISIDNLRKNFEFDEFFSLFIVKLDTKEFLEILDNLNFSYIANELRDGWIKFQKEVKKQIIHKFGVILKYPYWEKNKDYIKISKVITPLSVSQTDHANDSEIESQIDEKSLHELVNSDNNRILIKGEAGIGKTFHFMSILYSWANNDGPFQDYTILHIKAGEIKEKTNIFEEIFRQNFTDENTFVTLDLLEHYLSEECNDNDRKILLLIDEADEFKLQNSSFNSIISTNQRLCYPIIVWSRIWKAESIQSSYDYFYQVRGFNRNNIKEYLTKFFGEDLVKSLIIRRKSPQHSMKTEQSSLLMEFLENKDSEILKACRSPLFLHLVASVWKDKQSSMNVSESLIYEDFIDILFEKNRVTSNKEYYWQYCSKIAFDSILNNQPIQLTDEMKKFNYFGGIFIPNGSIKGTNEEKVKFVHNLFEEYFASKYILMNYEKDKDFIHEKLNNSAKTMFLTKVFYFIQESDSNLILSLLKNVPTALDCVENFDEQIIELIKYKSSLAILNLTSLILTDRLFKSIIYSMNFIIKEIYLENVKFNLKLFIEAVTMNLGECLQKIEIIGGVDDLLDVYLLEKIFSGLKNLNRFILSNVFFEDNNNYHKKLTFSSSTLSYLSLKNCNLNNFQFNENGLSIICSKLEYFDFSYNKILGSELVNFLSLLAKNTEVTTLGLKGCLSTINDEGDIENLSSIVFLKELLVCRNILHNHVGQRLLKVLHNDLTSLITLKMDDCQFTIYSASLLSLLQECSNLTVLNLFGTIIEEDENYNVLYHILHLKLLKKLKLPEIKCPKNELTDFNSILKKFQKISQLNEMSLRYFGFENNILINPILEFFFSFILHFSIHLECIYMNNIQIPNHVLVKIANLKFSKLNKLILTRIKTNENVLHWIKDLLENSKNDRLRLIYKNCEFDGENLNFLYKLRNILSINFSDNHLKKIDVNAVEKSDWPLLEEIHLSGTFIKKAFLNSIITSLKNFQFLKIIDLSNNNFNGETLIYFLRQLNNTKTLITELYLYGNNFYEKHLFKLINLIGGMKKLQIFNKKYSSSDIGSTIGENLRKFINSNQLNQYFVQILDDEIEDIIKFNFFHPEKYKILSINTIIDVIIQSKVQINGFDVDEQFFLKVNYDKIDEFFKIQRNLKTIELQKNINYYLSVEENNNLVKSLFNSVSKYSKGLQEFTAKNFGFDYRINEYLSNAISANKHLEKLDIRGNSVGSDDMNLVLDSIACNCGKISDLVLNSTGLDETIEENLLKVVSTNKNLSNINLGGNKLKSKAAKSLFQTLSKFCSNLHHLGLSFMDFNHEIGDSLAQVIANNKNLLDIDISANKIGNDIANELFLTIAENCQSLTEIGFGNIKIDHRTGKSLAKVILSNKNLDVFEIGCNSFGTDTTKELLTALSENHSNLTYIGLNDLHFDDGIDDSLSRVVLSNKNLKHIEIGKNKIGSIVGKQLLESISKNCCSFFRFGFLDIGLDDKIGDSLAKAIGSNVDLLDIEIPENKLGSLVAKNIFETISTSCFRLRRLGLGNINMDHRIEDSLAKAISVNENLKELELGNNKLGSEVCEKLFEAIAENCPKITGLWLLDIDFDESIGDSFLAAASNCKNLQYLEIGRNNIGNKIANLLFKVLSQNCSHLIRLGLLNIGLNSDLDHHICSVINNSRSLEEFEIGENSLGPDIVNQILLELARSSINLKFLGLGKTDSNETIGLNLAKVINRNKNLMELDLAFNPIGTKAMNLIFEAIADNCQNIIKLCVEDVHLDDTIDYDIFPRILTANKNLQNLDFSKNSIGSIIAKELFDSIADSCTSLTYLGMESCNFDHEIEESLSKAVAANKYLQHLDIGGNFIGNDLMKSLLNIIKENCYCLKVFICNSTGMDDTIGLSLEEAVLINTQLEHLELGNNKIGNDIANNLFHTIAINCNKFTQFGFFDIGIDHTTEENLVRAIRANKNLSIIELGENNLGSHTIKVVCDCISSSNLNLTYLGIESISMDDSIGLSLENVFHRNQFIKHIELGDNLMGANLSNLLLDAIINNISDLNFLGLSRIGMDNTVDNRLARIVEKNKDLEHFEIADNKIGSDCSKLLFQSIAENCDKLSRLGLMDIGFNSSIENTLTRAISVNKNLKELEISYNKLGNNLAKNLFRSINKNCSKLFHLGLSTLGFNQEIQFSLSDVIITNKNLKTFEIAENLIGPEIAKNIFKALSENCCNLTYLGLSNIGLDERIGNSLSEVVFQNPNLEEIQIGDNNLGSIVSMSLFNAINETCINFRNIGFYNLNFDEKAGKSLLHAISKNLQLTEIVLGKNLLGNYLTKDLFDLIERDFRDMSCLSVFSIGFNHKVGFSLEKAIAANENITELDIGDNTIGNKLAVSLLNVIADSCSNLTILGLRSIGMDQRAGKSLATVLESNSNMESLEVARNNLGAKASQLLLKSIAENCKDIKILNIKSIGMNSSVGSSLLESIKANQNLQILKIGYNKLGSPLTNSLFDTLTINCNELTSVDFSDINVDEDIEESISNLLENNKNLEKFKFGLNGYGLNVAKTIFISLQRNCSNLRKLSMNSIGLEEGFEEEFHKLITSNNSIEKINLSNNYFSEKVANYISDICRSVCKNLKECNVVCQSFDETDLSCKQMKFSK